nr:DDB1- and CUL4-associated factor 10-like [Aotus nancymaae]
MPRLHFQQRHIRFSSRRFWLGFVCSGGQAPAHFCSFSSSAPTPGEGRKARAGDALLAPAPARPPSRPGGSCPAPAPRSPGLQNGLPTRARPGGDNTSLAAPPQPSGDTGPLVSPRVWLGARPKGMRNPESKKTN